ncbi:MAG: DUF1489 domain-containing protein [Rhodobacteraceae bacterium]|nr:DUF1489 domain-containing protein [Paracoccaceae bacterium]
MRGSRQCQTDQADAIPDSPEHIPPGLIHMVKLCVGVGSVAALANLQFEGVESGRYRHPEHRTRNRPQRWRDLIAGGSIYWVVNGVISVRQSITAINDIRGAPGGKRCVLVFSPTLVLTRPSPMRPFQGWRYLSPADAPADVGPLERLP